MGVPNRGVARGGIGMDGTPGGLGTPKPGAGGAAAAAGRETSPTPGGIGCRGPDNICPGFGVEITGLTGMGGP